MKKQDGSGMNEEQSQQWQGMGKKEEEKGKDKEKNLNTDLHSMLQHLRGVALPSGQPLLIHIHHEAQQVRGPDVLTVQLLTELSDAWVRAQLTLF